MSASTFPEGETCLYVAEQATQMYNLLGHQHVEIRNLIDGESHSYLVSDPDQFAELAPSLGGNVYVTANRLSDKFIALAKQTADGDDGRVTVSAKNRDVSHFTTIFIDVDAERPKGVCSTDAEHASALEVVYAVREFTRSLGWADPWIGSSGNGYYAIYRCLLPNNRESRQQIANVLKAVADKCDTDAAKIDRKVHNPARIIRVMGTFNRKAESADRPSRMAQIIEGPELYGQSDLIVTEAQIQQLADTAVATIEESTVPTTRRDIAPLVERLLWIESKENEKDSTSRLYALCCRVIEMNYSDDDGLAAIRQYEKTHKFKRQFSDTDILKRIRDAEDSPDVVRGSNMGDWSQLAASFRGVCQSGTGKGAYLFPSVSAAAELIAACGKSLPAWPFEDRQAAVTYGNGRLRCEVEAEKSEKAPPGWLEIKKPKRFIFEVAVVLEQPRVEPETQPSDREPEFLPWDELNLANQVLATYTVNGKPMLVYYDGDWYVHDGYYQLLDPAKFNDKIYKLCKNYLKAYAAAANEAVTTFSRNDVANVAMALRSLVTIEQPGWVDGRGDQWLAFQDKLLNVTAWVNGELVFIDQTPDYFSTTAIPYPLAYTENDPTLFLERMREQFNESEESMLQEYGGYAMTDDTRFHVILYILGPPRSFKGTYDRLLQATIGKQNAVSKNLASFLGEHALQNVPGKTLLSISEARPDPKLSRQAVERLLSISGEDAQDINPKGRAPYTAKLKCKVLLISNILADLADPSGALLARFMFAESTVSYAGREDTELLDKILVQQNELTWWFLRGLRRLYQNGKFTTPQNDVRRRFKIQNGKIAAFVEETCVLTSKADDKMNRDELFQVFQDWCDANNVGETDRNVFFRDLYAEFPKIGKHERHVSGIKWADHKR